MEDNPQNDSQEVQPVEETNEQESGESTEVKPESDERDSKIEELQAEVEKKDKRIADLSSKTRDLKKEAKKSDTPKAENQSDELDYGQKAYLNTKEIVESEHDFVNEQLKKSGLSLNELLDNGYFKAKLQEVRDAKVVSEATPSQTRGATEPSSSKAQHWVDKGELPPDTPENRKLRIDVVNKRMEVEKNASQFTSQSVVEG